MNNIYALNLDCARHLIFCVGKKIKINFSESVLRWKVQFEDVAYDYFYVWNYFYIPEIKDL